MTGQKKLSRLELVSLITFKMAQSYPLKVNSCWVNRAGNIDSPRYVFVVDNVCRHFVVAEKDLKMQKENKASLRSTRFFTDQKILPVNTQSSHRAATCIALLLKHLLVERSLRTDKVITV